MTNLPQFLQQHREAILNKASHKLVEQKQAGSYRPRKMASLMAIFLDQTVAALQAHSDAKVRVHLEGTRLAASGVGQALQLAGANLNDVIHGYGAICEAVNDLATTEGQRISPQEYRLFNVCLDEAMAEAVTAFQKGRDDQSHDEKVEQTEKFIHELRNGLVVVSMSFDAIKSGAVGPSGALASILERNLNNLYTLVERRLAQVRLEKKNYRLQVIKLADIIDDVSVMIGTMARDRNVKFHLDSNNYEIDILSDRQLLFSAISNIVQNAVKYTKPGSNVWLRVATPCRQVCISVEDECGGLPSRQQPSDNSLIASHSRTETECQGLQRGLSIVDEAVLALGGERRTHNMPRRGCVQTLVLPLVGAENQVVSQAKLSS